VDFALDQDLWLNSAFTLTYDSAFDLWTTEQWNIVVRHRIRNVEVSQSDFHRGLESFSKDCRCT